MKERNTRHDTLSGSPSSTAPEILSTHDVQAIVRAYKLLHPVPVGIAIEFLSMALRVLSPDGVIKYLLGGNEFLGGRRPLDVMISGTYVRVFDDLSSLHAGITT